MIPDETVERVREAADIVEVIGEHVKLRRSGGDYRGGCPFHHGKNPNFSVSARRASYHCFKCGVSGDVFTFVRELLGLDFVDALKYVAAKYGIPVVETRARAEMEHDPREPLWEVNAAAAEIFQQTLWETPDGADARTYLGGRDISREVADQFRLGFAPRGRTLIERLATLGFDEERLLAAGLLVRREDDAQIFSRFRDRLMIPILNVRERCVGFGGRIMAYDSRSAKYLNSPETAVFSKGQLLYHLHAARSAIRRHEHAIIVEGYFDVIRLASAGVDQVVAGLGTALTADQAGLIARLTKNVFLLYDSDAAGQKATFRAALELLQLGVAVRVISIPEGEDPDTFVRKNGAAGLAAHVDAALDVLERQVQILERRGWFADLHKRRRAIDRLLPTLRATSDPITREVYLGRVSEISGVDRAVLQREVESVSHETTRGRGAPRPVGGEAAVPGQARDRRLPDRRQSGSSVLARPPGESAERELIGALLARPALVERVAERAEIGMFRHPVYAEILRVLMEEGAEFEVGALVASLSEPAVEVVQQLLEQAAAGFDVDRTFEGSVRDLIERRLIERSDMLSSAIAVATSEEEKNALIQEQLLLSEQRKELGGRRWRVGRSV